MELLNKTLTDPGIEPRALSSAVVLYKYNQTKEAVIFLVLYNNKNMYLAIKQIDDLLSYYL